MLEEGKGPRVPRSRGPKVPDSQGPRYLKLTFKYELDSKEGPSCFALINSSIRNRIVALWIIWILSCQYSFVRWPGSNQPISFYFIYLTSRLELSKIKKESNSKLYLNHWSSSILKCDKKTFRTNSWGPTLLNDRASEREYKLWKGWMTAAALGPDQIWPNHLQITNFYINRMQVGTET